MQRGAFIYCGKYIIWVQYNINTILKDIDMFVGQKYNQV